MKKLPIKTVYYTDERKDEFSSAVIIPRKIDDTYTYIPRGAWWKLKRFVLYRLIAWPLGWLGCKCCLGWKVRNKNVLKAVKGKGFFLYINHTQETADAFLPSLATGRSTFVIVHPNNVSQPFFGKLTPYLGALPLPDTLQAAKNFKAAVHTRYQEGHCVAIYPEAHIWPYYTGIRDFPSVSLRYPVECNAPVFTMTNVYKKRKIGCKPRVISYLDGPFYANDELVGKQKITDLRDRIYEKMTERSKLSDCEYIRYVKKGEE